MWEKIKKWIRNKIQIKEISLEMYNEVVNEVKSLKEEITNLNNTLKEKDKKIEVLDTKLKTLSKDLFLDVDFVKSLNQIVDNNVNNENLRFEKKIRLVNLHSSISYEKVMSTFNKLLDGVLDNYLLKKYVVPDNSISGFKPVNVTGKDRIEDMNAIYSNIMVLINTNFIEEQLGVFYDIYSLNTKEFFIVQFIEPLYTPKINTIIDKYNQTMNEIKSNYVISDIFRESDNKAEYDEINEELDRVIHEL